jgi:hypothetical protein
MSPALQLIMQLSPHPGGDCLPGNLTPAMEPAPIADRRGPPWGVRIKSPEELISKFEILSAIT